MKETLRQRLIKLPPFLAYALSKTRTKRLERADILKRFAWKNKLKRRRQKWKGIKIARKPISRRKSREEVAKISGLHPRKVGRIGILISWKTVTVEDMLLFLEGCGIDVFRMRRVRYYLSHGRQTKAFSHLTAAQMKKFDSQCKRYIETIS